MVIIFNTILQEYYFTKTNTLRWEQDSCKTVETIHIKFSMKTAPWSRAAKRPWMKREEAKRKEEKGWKQEILKIHPSRQIFTYKKYVIMEDVRKQRKYV